MVDLKDAFTGGNHDPDGIKINAYYDNLSIELNCDFCICSILLSREILISFTGGCFKYKNWTIVNT